MDKKIKDAFDRVTAEKELIKNTEEYVVQYMHEQNEKQTSRKYSTRRNVAVALAFTLVLAFFGTFVYLQPVSAVSIASTSSVEIYFNRFDRVVDVISFDEKGELTADKIAVQHKSFTEVMDEILSESNSEVVYVTVASQSEETTDEMIENLARHQEMMENMHVYQSSEEIMKQARNSQTPMGRMHALHQLREFDQEFSPAELEKESTRELMEIFERHHQEMMKGGHKHHQNGERMNGGPMHRRR